MSDPGGSCTPAQWARVKAVVSEALALPLPEREAHVAQAAADDPLVAREAGEMLAFAEEGGSTTSQPLEGALALGREAIDRAGQTVGAWRITREIGRGGMGAVYLAERADQEFKKRAALKILKRGTDTDEVLGRFRMERQILARLEHPNIARLLDGGTTPDGLPFFVLEHVDGVRITEFCDQHRLGFRARIELFLKACEAVHFAHRNLVVHRDLKPGNLLVTAEGEPKLLDFGIAKLLGGEEDGEGLTTEGRQLLTPGYASPEQVRGEAVTTASDVYSLGALLHELLTGRPPHRFATAQPSAAELRRVIVEEDAARASAVATTPEAKRALRGDLDNILRQALAKDPARRYTDVTALADDLRRHLEKRPVRARRLTPGYRLGKFIGRHRVGVTAGALAALAVVGGIGATLWQAGEARSARGRAERRFEQVRRLARAMLFDYHDAIAALTGSTEVRAKMVRDALGYLDALAQESGDDLGLLRELAAAYEKLADVQGGITRSVRRAVLTNTSLADWPGAEQSLTKAVALRERITRLAPDQPGDQADLAQVLEFWSEFLVARGQLREGAALKRRVIGLLAALPAGAQTAERRHELATSRIALAKVLGSPAVPNLGDPAGALPLLRQGIEECERLVAEQPGELAPQQLLVLACNAAAPIHGALGDLPAQLAMSRRAIEVNRRMVAAAPENAFGRRELAVQLGNLGSALQNGGEADKAEALGLFREAAAIFDALVADDPKDQEMRRAQAIACRNVGAAVAPADPAEGDRQLERARAILAELSELVPQSLDLRRQVAHTLLVFGRVLGERGDLPRAIERSREGARLAEALAANAKQDVNVRRTLGLLCAQLGTLQFRSAAAEGMPREEKLRRLEESRRALARANELLAGLQSEGRLPRGDAHRPAETVAVLAACTVLAASL